ncbi:MAG: hypothetical protein DRO98_03885, partial [Archaeoglobales archaeon]
MRPDKVFIGLAIIFLGFALLALSYLPNAEVGGVIVIGPFPIVLASSPEMALFGI